MIDRLQILVEFSDNRTDDNAPLTRQDVVRALIQTSFKNELRFQVSLRALKLWFIYVILCIFRV